MKQRTFNLFSDPSHGWLKVRKKEVEKEGLADKISSFSYVRGDYLYLEEDCDAYTFLNSLKKRGIQYKTKINFSNRSSRIRSYQPYSQPETKKND